MLGLVGLVLIEVLNKPPLLVGSRASVLNSLVDDCHLQVLDALRCGCQCMIMAKASRRPQHLNVHKDAEDSSRVCGSLRSEGVLREKKLLAG